MLKVRYEVHDVVSDGDTVAIRATAHGINAVAPQGIEPTGRPFAMKTGHFFRVGDGWLCEHWGIRLAPAELPLATATCEGQA